MVIMIEYNRQMRSSIPTMLVNDMLRMSLTFNFLSSDSSLDETMLLHFTDNFNIYLAISSLCSFTQYAAEAISFHVPQRNIQPSNSSTGCSLHRLIWEGHETTIKKICVLV